MNNFLLAVPTFNCEKQILRTLKSVDSNIDKFEEVIIFDNGSYDKTIENIKKFIGKKKTNSKYKFFINENNINLGGSHMNIFDYFLNSNFEFLIVLHGDDQGDITDFFNFINNNSLDNKKWIKFSRFMKNSKLIGYSNLKIIGNKVFNLLFSLISSKKVYDLGSGLDIYSKDFIKNCPYFNFPKDLTFDYYMTIYGLEKDFIFFYPQTWKEFDQISNVRLIRQSYCLIKILFTYLFYELGFNRYFFKKRYNDLSLDSRRYRQIL